MADVTTWLIVGMYDAGDWIVMDVSLQLGA